MKNKKTLFGILQLLLICFALEMLPSCSFSKTVGQNNKATAANRATSYKPQKVKKAEDDVEIVCVGDGKTLDEAVKMALRSGLEQTYGTFVSANTTILNDDLIKDEIVSLSTGNGRGYEVVSQNQSSDGTWNAVVKAVFSTGKLVSYVKSKGGSTELAGGTFAVYAKMEEMNEAAEVKTINNLSTQINSIIPLVYDYEVIAENPQIVNDWPRGKYYEVRGTIKCKLNNNASRIEDVFTNTLESVSLTSKEIIERYNAGLPVYPFIVEYYEGRVLDWMAVSKWLPSGSILKNGKLEYSKDLRNIIKNSKSVSQFETSLKDFLSSSSRYSNVYFLRTKTLENFSGTTPKAMTSPIGFVLSDGTTSITQRGTEPIGTYTFNGYVLPNPSLLTLDCKKGTLAYVYEGVLFEYKTQEELSKVSKITITPLRDAPK